MSSFHLVALFAIAILTYAHGADSGYSGFAEANGIRFSDYSGFEEKWKLVTVRFRSDKAEQRFTFANDKALAALKAESKDYPEGAVFVKIGVDTRQDPAFTSSRVPAGTKRYQIMVRNKAKYASTGGWGYALFDLRGKTFAEEPKMQAAACYQCHLLVNDRGQVFSQLMDLSPSRPAFAQNELPADRITFSDALVGGLPEKLKAVIPPETTHVKLLEGPLRKAVFSGTLDEIRPALVRQVIKFQMPAVFLSEDGKHFAMVMPADPKTTPHDSCPSGQKPFASVLSGLRTDLPGNGDGIIKRVFCELKD